MAVPERTSGESFAPVERTVEVGADRAAAFALFTEQIDSWWPMESHSVFGAGGAVGFEEGRLVERHGDRFTVWGDVLAWDPPSGFTVTWHPGRGPEQATEVAVSFLEEEPGRTRVRLLHRGWERRTPDVRSSYETGWSVVLDRFVAAAG